MATIDIFPLSIDNVKAPINLLSNLFTSVNPKMLMYPLDLGSNPQYCHAVQFTIFDYDISGAQNITSLIDSIGNYFRNPSIPSTTDLGISAKMGDPRAYVNLYMPDTVATTYDSDYTTISLTDTFGPLGYLTNALAGSKNWDDIKKNLNSEKMEDLAKYGGTKLAGALGNTLGMEGGNIAALLQQKLGVIPNPQMQLIYRGIALRQFQLEFIFTPVSKKEAESVEQIIKTFVHYSLPEKKGGVSGQFLTPPQVFRIKFAFLGNSSIQSALTNVFRNTLTNIFDSQLASMLTGRSPAIVNSEIESSAKNKTAKVFEIQDCVLTNVSVDYAPNGWAAYSDGHPIQTRLTLQFQEMQIQTKENVPIATNILSKNVSTSDIPPAQSSNPER